MDCQAAGRNITVHSADMDIQNSSVAVQDMQGNSVGISRFVYVPGSDPDPTFEKNGIRMIIKKKPEPT